MKLIAITTFPPSTGPLCSFGYHAVSRFLESSDIQQLVVLGDSVNKKELTHQDSRLVVKRCWHDNSLLSPIQIITQIRKIKPDIIWMNLQYTLFGTGVVPAFMGLLLPGVLRIYGYPVITTLHNFPAVINLSKAGVEFSRGTRHLVEWADVIAMKSVMASDIVFVLVKHYQSYLKSKYRGADVRFVEQDLWGAFEFRPPRLDQYQVLTTGVFGTYKKLEILLDSFQIVRKSLPTAKLIIAGQNHPRTRHYLETLFHKYRYKLSNVEYVGYVDDRNYPDVFRTSNVVVLTNTSVTGSSGVVRHAARTGRGLILPRIDLYDSLVLDGWGVEYYAPGSAENLAQVLLSVLTDPNKQVTMGLANHQRSMQSGDELVQKHLSAFHEVLSRRSSAL